MPADASVERMNLTPVKSSTVAAMAYEPGTATLRVRFKSGGTYDYAQVTPEIYAKLTSGGSIGSYLQKHIKPNHKHSKVEV